MCVERLHTCDDGLVPGEQVGEGGVGVVEHEVVLGAGQALEVDGGGARRHREVGRGRALRRAVVQAVVRAVRRALRAPARDLDHQVRGARAAQQCLHTHACALRDSLCAQVLRCYDVDQCQVAAGGGDATTETPPQMLISIILVAGSNILHN